ncbi:hypothetical protein [Marinobacter sp. F4216]|uniref:hypothetical protein n=1 Tax=Marinobacter sp. F4216 TaxID=2874281 RepID=UPI001CBA8ECA|nr:hypothetical protein [Marinobacter sp. F4216]MBZ2170385.1 hypothetical protein [Marinobacter sp. F4216]
MTYRFTKVDSQVLDQHYYLSSEDECFCLGEYTARGGFAASEMNQLILNLKKGVDRRGRPEYRYKTEAIDTIAGFFSKGIKLEQLSFIPVPPSKSKQDPLYDDRMCQILQKMQELNPNCHWEELIVQTQSTDANHTSANRKRPEEIEALYEIKDFDPQDFRPTVAILDDMLTTGAHFKAMQRKLQAALPKHRIVGFFVARRAVEEDDFAALFEQS